jgi:hypothetical protein
MWHFMPPRLAAVVPADKEIHTTQITDVIAGQSSVAVNLDRSKHVAVRYQPGHRTTHCRLLHRREPVFLAVQTWTSRVEAMPELTSGMAKSPKS